MEKATHQEQGNGPYMNDVCQQMLEKLWTKGSPPTLLLENQNKNYHVGQQAHFWAYIQKKA